jgi:hypothetical protein
MRPEIPVALISPRGGRTSSGLQSPFGIVSYIGIIVL